MCNAAQEDDELAKAMPVAEYERFVEGKQASFTFKKRASSARNVLHD
jgi:hypothetical protein